MLRPAVNRALGSGRVPAQDIDSHFERLRHERQGAVLRPRQSRRRSRAPEPASLVSERLPHSSWGRSWPRSPVLCAAPPSRSVRPSPCPRHALSGVEPIEVDQARILADDQTDLSMPGLPKLHVVPHRMNKRIGLPLSGRPLASSRRVDGSWRTRSSICPRRSASRASARSHGGESGSGTGIT